jgi:hypothetical protein
LILQKINIANPNSVGVSVNHYNKFNVGNQGAILNNSKVMGTSQLGGAVYGGRVKYRFKFCRLVDAAKVYSSFIAIYIEKSYLGAND